MDFRTSKSLMFYDVDNDRIHPYLQHLVELTDQNIRDALSEENIAIERNPINIVESSFMAREVWHIANQYYVTDQLYSGSPVADIIHGKGDQVGWKASNEIAATIYSVVADKFGKQISDKYEGIEAFNKFVVPLADEVHKLRDAGVFLPSRDKDFIPPFEDYNPSSPEALVTSIDQLVATVDTHIADTESLLLQLEGWKSRIAFEASKQPSHIDYLEDNTPTNNETQDRSEPDQSPSIAGE